MSRCCQSMPNQRGTARLSCVAPAALKSSAKLWLPSTENFADCQAFVTAFRCVSVPIDIKKNERSSSSACERNIHLFHRRMRVPEREGGPTPTTNARPGRGKDLTNKDELAQAVDGLMDTAFGTPRDPVFHTAKQRTKKHVRQTQVKM